MIPTSRIDKDELNRLKISGNRFLKDFNHYYDEYNRNLSFKSILNKLIEYQSNSIEFLGRGSLESRLTEDLKFNNYVFKGDIQDFLDIYNFNFYIFSFHNYFVPWHLCQGDLYFVSNIGNSNQLHRRRTLVH